jgi:hypothetical protein
LSQRVGSNMTGGLIPRPEDDRVVSFSRLAIDTPITAEADTTRIAPPPPPVTEDPFAKEKRRELAALLRAGMDEMQATLIVNAKYRNRSSGPIRTY